MARSYCFLRQMIVNYVVSHPSPNQDRPCLASKISRVRDSQGGMAAESCVVS